MKNQTGHNFILRILLFFAIGFFACALVIAVLHLAPAAMDAMFTRICEQDFTHSTAIELQISVSFIVVSLITVFSQKSKIIYWEDVFEYKLIIPFLTNFNAIVSYIFSALIWSVVLLVLGSGYIYVSFMISLVLMVWLSLKMLSALFSDNLIKKDLEKEFAFIKQHKKENADCRAKYRRIKMGLMEYTIQDIDSNEIKCVCDNIGFLYRMEEYDDAEYLVDRITDEKKYYLLSRIIKTNSAALLNARVFEYYRQLCLALVRDASFTDTQYLRSIYKSITECVMEHAQLASASALETAFQSFSGELLQACADNGRTDLHDAVYQLNTTREWWNY